MLWPDCILYLREQSKPSASSCFLVAQLCCTPSEASLCNSQGGSCLLLSCLCSTSCWKACLSAINRLLLFAAVTSLQHMLLVCLAVYKLLLSQVCWPCQDACLSSVIMSAASVEPETQSLHRQMHRQNWSRLGHSSVLAVMLLCSGGLKGIIYRYEPVLNSQKLVKYGWVQIRKV